MVGLAETIGTACLHPRGERVYAIGDIHGEDKLFQRLLGVIVDDEERRAPARTTLVLLGDFIDRGAGVAEILWPLRKARGSRIVVLKGNHEATMVAAWHGDLEALEFWLRYGGDVTLRSLGLSQAELTAEPDDLSSIIRSRIDRDVIDWLDGLPTSWTLGDYHFVHAGIRPGIALDQQSDRDRLWIRRPFLASRRDHGKLVVHGHTVEGDRPVLRKNRIGLDTGAHEHGRLSALGLEADERWFLQATDPSRSGSTMASSVDQHPTATYVNPAFSTASRR